MHPVLAWNIDRSAVSPSFDTEISLCSSDGSRKRSVGGKVKNLLDAFGWQDYICATLVGVSGGQLREMLRSVACRCVENDWAEDLNLAANPNSAF